MGGNCQDWDTWVEILAQRYPDWEVLPLQRIQKDSRFLAAGLDTIADLAACEIAEAVRARQGSLQRGKGAKVTLHCIGHSMGGLVIRGALPKLFRDLIDTPFELGHYISLSSPHLGIQSSWWSPTHAWRNLCWLSAPISQQLAHLAIQDTSGRGLPYLVELSNPEGEHLPLLARFRSCTCVSLACGDALISLPSGVIHPDFVSVGPSPSSYGRPFWRLDAISSIDGPSAGEKKLQASCPSSGKFAAGLIGSKGLFSMLIGQLVHLWDLMLSFDNAARKTPMTGSETPRKYGRPLAATSRMSAVSTPKQASQLSWTISEDLTCKYPSELMEGLRTIPWRRIVAHAHHWPYARNMHVFLIGKQPEQFVEEHRMSRECIEWLVEILAE
eukprot:TRINITY_DN16016_c2_g4_i2.p1 TRINITY_DN16016_c2_g4~~TRINITY_DN16016_c2_g4_i2.p1  ORF type:complete len:427 (-),score=49.57 TRINITY_DN16016_c2_g4_i2:84-1238(-)